MLQGQSEHPHKRQKGTGREGCVMEKLGGGVMRPQARNTWSPWKLKGEVGFSPGASGGRQPC